MERLPRTATADWLVAQPSPEDEGQRTVDGGIVGVLTVSGADVDARVTLAIEGAASVHNLQSGNETHVWSSPKQTDRQADRQTDR